VERKSHPDNPGTMVPAASYFLLVFVAGFVLGMVRVPFLVPWIGTRTAELLEMPLMLVAIVWSARFVVRRFSISPGVGPRVAVGIVALALLVAAELVTAYGLQGLEPSDYIASRDPISGAVYVAMLVIFALMPALVLRRPNNPSQQP